MKKIIFIINQLRVGGVAKALVELLRNIEGKYDISVLCFEKTGNFFNDIPQNVKIINDIEYLEMTECSVTELDKQGSKLKNVRRICSLWTKVFGKKYPAYYITNKCGIIEGDYDVAIAFGHPMPDNMFCNLTSEVTLRCIRAKKKVIVIHCDFESYGGNSKYNRKIIKQFDVVSAVSESVGKAVVRCIPEVKSKMTVLRNCHDYDEIKRMANIEPVNYTNTFNFISVARLSEEKGLERCIPIFKEVHDKGYDVSWHIVGDGPLRRTLQNDIVRYGVGRYVFLEGEQINPYRFMKNAGFLLVPSFHEAAPMVFDEAASLGIPIVSTKTLSAIEMVEHRNLGIVCENSKDGITMGVLKAIETLDRNRIDCNYVASNDKAIKEFNAIVEDEL